MKKYCLDFTVVNNEAIHELYSLLTLTPSDSSTSLPDILPGQFVQVRVDNAETFLRRPISVNDVDRDNHTLSLLVRNAGEGSRWIMNRRQGDTVNLMLPLGNGFGNIAESDNRPLLVGGGVGIAPMLYLGKCMSFSIVYGLLFLSVPAAHPTCCNCNPYSSGEMSSSRPKTAPWARKAW